VTLAVHQSIPASPTAPSANPVSVSTTTSASSLVDCFPNLPYFLSSSPPPVTLNIPNDPPSAWGDPHAQQVAPVLPVASDSPSQTPIPLADLVTAVSLPVATETVKVVGFLHAEKLRLCFQASLSVHATLQRLGSRVFLQIILHNLVPLMQTILSYNLELPPSLMLLQDANKRQSQDRIGVDGDLTYVFELGSNSSVSSQLSLSPCFLGAMFETF